LNFDDEKWEIVEDDDDDDDQDVVGFSPMNFAC
jgi:hypothetical protein